MSRRWPRQRTQLGVVLFSLLATLAVSVPYGGAYFRQEEQAESTGTALPPPSLADHTFPNCRFGIAATGDEMSQFDIISNLNAGWHLDFVAALGDPGPPEAEYAPMVRLNQDWTGSGECGPDYGYWANPPLTAGGLGARVDGNPGALWIVGNEPDRVGQDGVCPQQYADAYHDVYHFIKERDPTATCAVGGLVGVTPGRIQYLEIVWDTYVEKYDTPMPVDVWTMHIYVLSETGLGDAHIALGTDSNIAIPYNADCDDPGSLCHAEHDDIDLFVEQVVRMREWMKQHGERDKPLLLAPFGLLKPYHWEGGVCSQETCPSEGDPPGCFCDEKRETFHPARVADFMEGTFNYILTATHPALGYPVDGHRLVQQWLWYTLATPALDGVAHASNLADRDDGFALTLQGQRWRNYVKAVAPAVNLFPVRVPPAHERAPDGTGPVTITLSAEVMNNGNTAVSGPVTVTFYSDAGLTEEIGSTIFTNLGGCARRVALVTTAWENLSSGIHSFWVKVDSTEDIAETDETDNVMQGLATVDLCCIHLPLILRGAG